MLALITQHNQHTLMSTTAEVRGGGDEIHFSTIFNPASLSTGPVSGGSRAEPKATKTRGGAPFAEVTEQGADLVHVHNWSKGIEQTMSSQNSRIDTIDKSISKLTAEIRRSTKSRGNDRQQYDSRNNYNNSPPQQNSTYNNNFYDRGGRGNGGRGNGRRRRGGGKDNNDSEGEYTSGAGPMLALKANTVTGIVRGGNNFKADIASDEIDKILSLFDVYAMPSMFTITAVSQPEAISTGLRARFQEGQSRLLLPIWIRHHWIAGFIRGKALFIADSAPGHASTKDINELHKFIQGALKRPLDLIFLNVPRQPRQSMECGIHMIANLLLLNQGALLEVSGTVFVSLNSVRKVFSNCAKQLISPQETYCYCRGALAYQANNLKEVDNDTFFPAIFEAFGPGPMSFMSIRHRKGAAYETTMRLEDGVWVDESNCTYPKRGTLYTAVVKGHQLLKYDADRKVAEGNPLPAPQTTATPTLQSANNPASSTSVATCRPNKKVSTQNHPQADLRFDVLYADNLGKNVIPPEHLERWTGEEISTAQALDIIQGAENPTPAAFNKALAISTQKAHRRSLRFLTTHLPRSAEPLEVGLINLILSMAAEKSWAPTTTMTRLTQIQGALALIFMYRQRQAAILLKGCPRWLQAIKSTGVKVQAFTPNQPLAATKAQVLQAIAREPRPEVKAALEIAWLTAGRGQDTLYLLAKDLQFAENNLMTVSYRQGKTASRQAYTVGIPHPSQETLDYLEKVKQDRSWAFPGVLGENIMHALRRVHPKLEQRSLRRGRLQYLSGKGMTDIQLKELSHHADVAMLRRYLDMGVVSATTRTTAALAAETEDSL
eukprot:GILI01013146.1.p1 GENE.GILI01013146.1~~GILI01013146.1.p1  ORF type:complete len:831 (-),score=73.66 GILI01013146.1:1212-3704(-)